MHNHPSLSELVEAVKHFVDEMAAPSLEGHARFHARVASNVLEIILRELEHGPSSERAEAKGLAGLLGSDKCAENAALNQALCAKIASGELTKETPGLLAHLKTTAIAQLSIDQPHYSGLKNTLETAE